MKTVAMTTIAVLVILCPLATAHLVFKVDDSKQYPVTKVITLLKDMQAQLEKEGEEDEEVYDKMHCWCITNDRDKSFSIKEAEARVADLTTTIESSAAASGRLKVEVANHQSDLDKCQKAVDQLTSMRERQAKEFNGAEKDMLQSISSLGSAIVVLSKHSSGGDKAAQALISSIMKTQMERHEELLQFSITPQQRRVAMGSLLQQQGTSFMSYAPASSEIFGILRQMKETFEGNLADSQKEEIANAKAFQEQKAAKMDEMKAISGSLDQKMTQLAQSDELNAQSKEDLQDTQDSLSVDDKFIIDLKERCKMTDAEWEIRTNTRQEELSSIVEAISILSDDAARDSFSKTLGGGAAASFVQEAASHHSAARAKAAKVLEAAGARLGIPGLSNLAMAAQLDAFTKVKAAIDKMVKELAEESKAEVAQKDYCVEKLNENQLVTEKQVRKNSDTESAIAGLKTTIKELTETLKTLQDEIAEMNVQIKRAGEDRELVNKDFQQTIADQRETAKLLNKALTVLKAVYITTDVTKKAAALGQQHSYVDAFATPPPPPAGFKTYQKSQGGGGAVALLTQILGDAKVLAAEALKDEQKAQEAYESLVKNTNDAISSKQNAIVNKSQDKAKAEQDLGEAKTDLEQQTTQLEILSNAKGDLKLECDFLLKNFEVRQQARAEEIDALGQAKAILSGMQVD